MRPPRDTADVTITLTGMGASLAAKPRARNAVTTVLANLRFGAKEFPRVTLGPGTMIYAAPDAIGVAVDGLALTLRGLGYSVGIRTIGPWRLEHACGTTLDPEAWISLPAARVELAAGLKSGRAGFVEVRMCACGEEVPLAEMTVVYTKGDA